MSAWPHFGEDSWLRPRGWLSRPWMGYVSGIVLTSLAALLRWALPGVLSATPFLAFYPAVVAAAMLGGFGPGMVATVASTVCYMLWFAPDPVAADLHPAAEWMRIAIFAGGGAGVSLLARRQRQAQEAEHRRAEELRVSDERHRIAARQLEAIMDAVPGGICVAHDPQCGFVTGNKQAHELLGVPLGANISATPHDQDAPALPHFRVYCHAHEVPGTEMPMQVAGATGSVVRDWECEVVHRDGTRQTLLINAAPLRSSDGAIWGVVGTFTDISERKQAEEALRHSREDLNRAQSVAQTGSWRLDVQRNELLWSDETHRIFGIPKGTPLTYEKFLAAVHHEDRQYVDRQWQMALQGESYETEHRIVVGNQIKWVQEKSELEFDAEGNLRSGFGTVQDVSYRKQTEEELKAAKYSAECARRLPSRPIAPRTIFWLSSAMNFAHL